MPEPITLTVVGTAVVLEGVKFLYGQAAEAIKRWRESRNAAPTVKPAPAEAVPSKVFAGQLAPLEFHLEQVEVLEKHLLTLRAVLAEYVDGLAPLASDDHAAFEAIDALRQSMEAVYQQRLTFVGEQRAPSGPVVEGTIDAKTIAGNAVAVEARLVTSGRVVGRVVADRLEQGSSATAVKVDIVGGRP
ncbi:hypothetical protein [Variovorax saccharolyticus]|uniref:hypothetical protein n=1 Tax=Variovorax saccharolyticus TaxID=3053516 RepID=UPI0025754FA0|nr:hypothetical protein [Variovorax sp. J31P216]MDM0030059.1 hypothetical protein [Variovorax sp. J31P216]